MEHRRCQRQYGAVHPGYVRAAPKLYFFFRIYGNKAANGWGRRHTQVCEYLVQRRESETFALDNRDAALPDLSLHQVHFQRTSRFWRNGNAQ
jgi:hypothetical protein